jgi:hypothetical protein
MMQQRRPGSSTVDNDEELDGVVEEREIYNLERSS